MQQVLIVIHLIVVLALVGVILLQRSEGGALGGLSGGGGVSGFLTGRGQANALTRATAILGAVFFCTSLILGIMAAMNRAPKSILDSVGSVHLGPCGARLHPPRRRVPAVFSTNCGSSKIQARAALPLRADNKNGPGNRPFPFADVA